MAGARPDERRLEWGGKDRTYVLDLSGEVSDDVLPEGVHRVVIDSTSLVRTDDDAIDLATIRMQSGAAGAGGGNGGSGGDAFWENVSTAPLAAILRVSCIDFISKRWRSNQTEPVKLPRLLMVVDELCNTLPWPKLPTVVTESRAMGIHLLVAVQAASQFARRYGTDGMNELRDVFPASLLLVGAREKEMLEKAAWWYGESERQKVSTDHIGRQSQSSEKAETVTATDLLPRSKVEGRLLRGSRPGEDGDAINEAGLLVSLVDISGIKFHS